MTRRELINRITIGGITFLVIPSVFTSCEKEAAEDEGTTPGTDNKPDGGKKITIDLTQSSYTALNNVGGSVIVQGVIVANLGGGNYIALASICTHSGCEITFNSSLNNFPCLCHGSVFSTTGSVLNGPATAALKSYSVIKTDNILTINL